MVLWPNQREPLVIATKGSDYHVTDADAYIRADARASTVTLFLPPSVGRAGKVYIVKKVDDSGHPVTLQPSAAETIAGREAFHLFAPRSAVTLRSDGQNWMVFNFYRGGAR
jgi:hypothetical protein